MSVTVQIPPGALLVADECHNYGGLNAEALQQGRREPGEWPVTLAAAPFGPRLGLSATVERADGGHEDILFPILGQRVYKLSFADVLTEQDPARPWVAPLKLGYLGVAFDGTDRETYIEIEEKLKRGRRRLVALGCPSEPPGAFIAGVTAMARGGSAAITARTYMANFNKRRELLADAAPKIAAMDELIPAIKASNRTIIFTQQAATSVKVFRMLEQNGVTAATIDADTKNRTQILSCFRRGQFQVLIAPKVLDEGVNVPEADLGIIVCGSRSKLQMIQRLGRVLRPKADGRKARLLFLVMTGSVEDPAAGGGAPEFVEQVRELKPEERRFSEQELGALVVWLSEFAPGSDAQGPSAPLVRPSGAPSGAETPPVPGGSSPAPSVTPAPAGPVAPAMPADVDLGAMVRWLSDSAPGGDSQGPSTADLRPSGVPSGVATPLTPGGAAPARSVTPEPAGPLATAAPADVDLSRRVLAEAVLSQLEPWLRWPTLARDLREAIQRGVLRNPEVRRDWGGRPVIFAARRDGHGPIVHFWGTGHVWFYTSNPGDTFGSQKSPHHDCASASDIRSNWAKEV